MAWGPTGDPNGQGWPKVVVWAADPARPAAASARVGTLAEATRRPLGERDEARLLAAMLARLRLDPEAVAIGLRTGGAIAPGRTLWQGGAADGPPPSGARSWSSSAATLAA